MRTDRTRRPARWYAHSRDRVLMIAVRVPDSLDHDQVRALSRLMVDDEFERMRRMPKPAADRFAVGRALIRRAVGSALRVPPSTVAWQLGPLGKPMLAGGAIHFTLSHCEGWVVSGMSNRASLGVDVEPIRGLPEAVMRRALLADELSRIEQHEESEREALFARTWVVKEACVKALGEGLARVRGVHVTEGSRGRWNGLRWEILQISDDVAAAVATKGAELRTALRVADVPALETDEAWTAAFGDLEGAFQARPSRPQRAGADDTEGDDPRPGASRVHPVRRIR